MDETGGSLTPAVGNSAIEFAQIDQEKDQFDCDSTPRAIWRVRRDVSADSIRARLANDIHVWRQGNELTFATEENATSVELQGGLQYPMSRIRGSNLWVITLRVAGLDSAVVSYFFLPIGPDVPIRSYRPTIWRGPLAPVASLSSTVLHGRVIVDSVADRAPAQRRPIVVYIPPAPSRPEDVVYLGDGASVRSLATTIDTLIAAGVMPPVMLVGIVSAPLTPSAASGRDPRAAEYLWNYVPDNSRFIAHERLWLDEVMPLAETKYGAPKTRQSRAVWGISNSAAWAIEMGLRHPDLVGSVLAFSPGGEAGRINPGASFKPAVRFYLLGGTLEPDFNRSARIWRDTLSGRGETVLLREPVAGHDFGVWRDYFPRAVAWAFGRGAE
ncbi:MAG TPA: alpha/beta hydrolase-fold protein [Gemmatimonadaceae bacterium]|nr:alpha/beta hydrolase-fold protein [Gemmatimonadaceae bacterium]